MEDWKIFKLSELVSLLGDGIHGTPKYTENGEYYFLNGNNLVDGSILIKPDTKRVSKDEYLKHKRNLNDRTLLVSINGTIGKVAYYNGEKVMLGKSACYFNVKNDVSKEFIKQVISSKYFIDYLESNFTGSVIKNISLKSMRDFPVNLPPLEEQKSIAYILSALDDKIELNLQMNKTLEEMAMALYKHWFVDFGPFQKGKFIESELGMIPEGWEVKRLEEIVEVCSSNRIFLKEYVDYGIPFYRGKEIIQLSKGMNISTELYITNERYNDIKSKAGVPQKNDILISSVGTIGVSWLVEDNNPFYFKDGNLTWLKNYTEQVNGNFMSLWLKSNETQEQIKSETIGSTQQALTISALRRLKIILPPKNSSIISDISDELVDWHNLFISNKNEIRTLTTLRDTLLPKLISGEVRVKDTKQILAAAL